MTQLEYLAAFPFEFKLPELHIKVFVCTKTACERAGMAPHCILTVESTEFPGEIAHSSYPDLHTVLLAMCDIGGLLMLSPTESHQKEGKELLDAVKTYTQAIDGVPAPPKRLLN